MKSKIAPITLLITTCLLISSCSSKEPPITDVAPQTAVSTPTPALSASITPSLTSTPTSTETPVPTIPVISLVGDKDGFGLGLQEGDFYTSESGFFDKRNADPMFTDVYPMDDSITYTHTFDTLGRIQSAYFTFLTLGIQDGDTQVPGSDVDERMYINGKEIIGAFDDVDQFAYVDSNWAGIVGTVKVFVPSELFSELDTGVVDVEIEIMQYGESQSIDAIAIDYSELVINYYEDVDM